MKTTRLTEKSLSLSRNKAKTERKITSLSEYANVNTYKHFLAVPTANDPYIKWAIGLRAYDPPRTLSNSGSMPPDTYYKTIESRKVEH